MDSLIQYNNAVNAIKTAILQGQYEAAKGVNRIQLALYFAIGKYLSQHTRKGVWGEGALAAISEQLRKELPGLRGFSETQMKDMRRFYEAWNMLDSNSAGDHMIDAVSLKGCFITVNVIRILFADRLHISK